VHHKKANASRHKVVDSLVICDTFILIKKVIHSYLAVDNAVMFTLTDTESSYKGIDKEFIVFGPGAKSPIRLRSFFVLTRDIENFLREFHFAQMHYSIGTLDYHIYLRTGKILLCIGITPPC